MDSTQDLCFKIASEPWEFDAIHALNYRTFVEEIPQHTGNGTRRLVDKFHHQNTYIICVKDRTLLGMLAVRDQRPFSLDTKLESLDAYLPPYASICEIRLLAIEKKYRNSAIFTGILKKVFDLGISRGYDLGIISGTTRQIKLYKHVGMIPFGPLVGTKDALYQPMYITFDRAMAFKQSSHIFRPGHPREMDNTIFNYLPGPVSVAEGVRQAHAAPPHSHREPGFMKDFAHLRQALCQRVNADNVHIMMGAGTLANDVVAAQLSLLPGKGLVLVNGEFGGRLEDHARRTGLRFNTFYAAEGETFDLGKLEKRIETEGAYEWLWAVQCETSTGVLNNAPALNALCKKHDIKLCLDTISAMGACPVDLNGTYLASATSGKGVGSLAGLALVFCGKDLVLRPGQLPRYLDLACYDEKQGIPYTLSSNAIYALLAAIKNSDWDSRFANVTRWSQELNEEIETLGLQIVANRSCRAPYVTTIALPAAVSSRTLGDTLGEAGILVSYLSDYLLQKNQIQICLMGDCQKPTRELIYYLREALSQTRQPAETIKSLTGT